MAFATIQFAEPEPGKGLITLSRPDRLNALSLDMVEEMFTLFGQLHHREQVRVLIITGDGRGFCSGADLKDARIRGEAAIELENRNQSICCCTPELLRVIEDFNKRKTR